MRRQEAEPNAENATLEELRVAMEAWRTRATVPAGARGPVERLGLVVNALILWTTRYMDAALNHLRATGADVKKEDLARLSPLSHKHFNMLGRYHFGADLL